MPKKRKVPVVRAWRCKDAGWFAGGIYLFAGRRWYWFPKTGPRAGDGWLRIPANSLYLKERKRKTVRELPPAVARRLNQRRLKAMTGRKS